MTKGLLPLSAIIARIVNSGQFRVDAFINLDSARFDILLEKVMNGNNTVLVKYFRKPRLQTKPGRKIGVPSFRQE